LDSFYVPTDFSVGQSARLGPRRQQNTPRLVA
jgi:hypothetical protein